MAPKNGTQFTMKTWSAMAGLLSALGVIHTMVFVPVIRASVSEDIDKAVEAHEQIPSHPGAVSHREFSLIIDQLNRIESRLDR